MKKIIETTIYILIAGTILSYVLYTSEIRELNNSVVYEGCFEQYIANNINPVDFEYYMTNCMK